MQLVDARMTRFMPDGLLALALVLLVVTYLPSGVLAADPDTAELERRVEELTRELEQARQALEAARAAQGAAAEKPDTIDADVAAASQPGADKIRIGPLSVGGAMRVNYVLGDYSGDGDGPSRGGDGGNFELDTFRINMSLEHEQLIGDLEYRWYDGYNFLHTGWLGYRFADQSEVLAGVTRVPFGPGPYGISQSWFFDQHYYVGLADDADLGLRYLTGWKDWQLDFAYFISSEPNGRGASEDSARYGYDAVRWRSGLDQDGAVVSAPVNGYEERNQFNVRAIYSFPGASLQTEAGISLQYGQLSGRRADDGDHWAASAHMVNQLGNFRLASQLTRYRINIDSDNLLGTDKLIPMGAYDFAWPVATAAWIPAVSLSYMYVTPQLPWLDYLLPYIEYSNIIKDESAFNDSQLFILGSAWASGGWYIYTDLAYSDGNLFVGNEGDDYANIYQGVGDFGVDGNDDWNYRFNINFGYYF
ncbi:MAG: hypothetical protein PVG72_13085 [Gammaproteobacteria bacterium]|jgi:hypothetical protein